MALSRSARPLSAWVTGEDRPIASFNLLISSSKSNSKSNFHGRDVSRSGHHCRFVVADEGLPRVEGHRPAIPPGGGPCALTSRSGVKDRANVDGMKVAIFWRLGNRRLVGREWFLHRLPGRY
jgi:hypothetical protein